MGAEQDVQKKIEEYQELAKKNPQIDVASLMMSALAADKRERVSARKKRWSYLISIGMPPLGLFIALWYYFSDKADAKRVAAVCVVLTIASLLVTWAILDLMFASLGPDVGTQLQTVNVNDVRSLFQ